MILHKVFQIYLNPTLSKNLSMIEHHYRTSTSGPTLMVLRPQMFETSNIEAHLHGLKALIQYKRNDKPCVSC